MAIELTAVAGSIRVGNPVGRYVLVELADLTDNDFVARVNRERLARKLELTNEELDAAIAYLNRSGLVRLRVDGGLEISLPEPKAAEMLARIQMRRGAE